MVGFGLEIMCDWKAGYPFSILLLLVRLFGGGFVGGSGLVVVTMVVYV